MRAQLPPSTAPPTAAAVRALCRRHTGLTALALAELAPIAADGHVAHLILFIAAHAGEWTAGHSSPPSFVARSRLAATMTWAQAEEYAADPAVHARLEGHRAAGEIATTHLVGLAEGMIRRIVRQQRLREAARTTVIDVQDMLNTGRAAVAQGVWAYDPSRPSGAHYLRAWIEEHVKRDLAGLTYQVTLPARTYGRFLRIAAVNAALYEQLGRPPTDAEVLARHDGAFTQADLDDERQTRMRRRHTGLGLGSLVLGSSTRLRESDSVEVPLLHLATQDRSDHQPDDWEEEVLQQVTNTASLATSGWRVALDVLQLGQVQREIVARSVGLPPYEQLPDTERSERAVATQLGIKRCAVHDLLTAVRAELRTPGGRLHHLVAQLTDEDLEGMGLQCFAEILGPLPPTTPPPGPVPQIFTKSLPHKQDRALVTILGHPHRLLVRYECRGSCRWAGYETALASRFVLPWLRCPDCGADAEAVRHRSASVATGGEAG
ncbi:hypothetical protein M8C13_32355 [Crossiella sp. SN42]|uniref:hypothetical protein n=1 Tax=Crossiella sp. SN42 TaxID=2944808 RepID=UPI00207D312C|nr:hypothetical protein [Crossiella sp. SN42]MCO1580456.1 hypothetical protein [Crossiella sp. SN42]